MLDIETLGMQSQTTPVVCSIGAVVFDLDGIKEEFYTNVVWEGHFKADTVKWWLKQSDAARNAILNEPTVPLLDALIDLMWFVGDKPVWGNGVDFDNAILQNWYAAKDLKGWSYRQNRCFRTIKNIYNSPELWVRPDVAHDALSDAKAQALHLINIARKYGVPL